MHAFAAVFDEIQFSLSYEYRVLFSKVVIVFFTVVYVVLPLNGSVVVFQSMTNSSVRCRTICSVRWSRCFAGRTAHRPSDHVIIVVIVIVIVIVIIAAVHNVVQMQEEFKTPIYIITICIFVSRNCSSVEKCFINVLY